MSSLSDRLAASRAERAERARAEGPDGGTDPDHAHPGEAGEDYLPAAGHDVRPGEDDTADDLFVPAEGPVPPPPPTLSSLMAGPPPAARPAAPPPVTATEPAGADAQ